MRKALVLGFLAGLLLGACGRTITGPPPCAEVKRTALLNAQGDTILIAVTCGT